MNDSLDSINDFLNQGGGAPGAKFTNVGDSVQGSIVSARTQQQTDIQTGAPKFFQKTGDPMMELVIILQTDERRADIADDDGQRSIYAKGAADRKGILDGIRTAVQPHGGLRLGGELVVKYIGNGTRSSAAFSAPKQYAVGYRPPAAAAVSLPSEDLTSDLPF